MIPNQIIWTESSISDFSIIISYYSEFSIAIAEKITFNIFERTSQLIKHPKSGQKEILLGKLKFEYRYLIEGNYKIIYRIEKQTIYIERIFDTRQNPTKIKKKIDRKK